MDGSISKEYCSCGFGEELFTSEGGLKYCIVCNKQIMPAQMKEKLLKKEKEISKQKDKRPVLIVDDQEFFREFLMDILIKEEYIVSQARDGIEAIKSMIEDFKGYVKDMNVKLPLVILDLNMPGLLSGIQTLGVLKLFNEHLLVIILTSVPPEKELLATLKKLGAQKYINKKSKNLDELIIKNINSLID